jgi:hypothetical protein
MTSPGRRIVRSAALVGFGGWFVATTFAQHPMRMFDRVRVVRDSWAPPLPDWRFFAPEPGRWDNHVLVRVVDADGTASAWREALPLSERRWRHAVFFPEHRKEKALIDVADQLMRHLSGPPVELDETAPYHLLRGFVEGIVRERHADATGFQFLLVRDAGHDTEGELALRLLSRLERL